jgi:RNA polymerase sigma-70 factor, ECF subfamily
MRDLIDRTDEELVSKTANGDAHAYGCLYDRYFEQIYRYVYFRVNTSEEAEDLVETVFLKTYEVIKKHPTKIESFKPWLYRTAANQVIDHYRTRKESFSLDLLADASDGQSSPEMRMVFKEDQHRLRKALERLEPTEQKIIAFRFVSGLSHAETAKAIGVKEDYVRVLQYRALRKLRKILKDGDGHE